MMKLTLGIKIEKDFNRPWGGFIKFIENSPYSVKIHYIKNGESLSLQYHRLRKEFWYVISGKIKATVGRNQKKLKKKILEERQFIFFPKNFLHRVEALKSSKCLEISLGKFKEEDIVRIEDKYGRK